ncbi:hypothetical protein HNQ77_002680 [Silvibacterium bohemicum]|uniref:Prohead serine protease domain-containing protein n=1 Tax=Silvibacterium bohemicum TaxID=1577686 RepID=A0A841K399_9BACT|nr:HK97 family phage prohead protease [Silvibacterium bohemicum]MBB6144724.1 hypothetical protein [Silvibacterium bohemicum]
MNKKLELRHIPARELRVAQNADGSRSITGYSAVFNLLSVDFGGWNEMVSPTAFTRSLTEQPDVLCLYNHSSGKVLGRTKSGTLTLEVDNIGLKFTCVLPDTSVARDLAVSLERGDIDGCSFGFVTNSDVWTSLEDGTPLRTLLDVTLYEVTITSEPAYPDTSVSLRSAPKELRSRLQKRDDDGDDVATDSFCSCTCPECTAGNCEKCSDETCSAPECRCTDMRSKRAMKHKMEMRLRLAQARTKA